MASDKTRGPVEQQLLSLLNKTEEVTVEEVQSLLTNLLDCTREDMFIHQTLQGKITAESQSGGRI